MDKKQAGIILTLIALIVCAALLSSKVSNNFDGGPGNLSQTVAFNDDKTTTDKTKNDYFYDAKNTREQSAATTMESLKQIENDANATKDNKENAAKALQEMAINKNNQTKIELEVKAKGYEDSICFIENDKVKVVVKSKDELTEKQCIQIQDIVKSVTNRSDVMIERKE